jgi:hypothetical protein
MAVKNRAGGEKGRAEAALWTVRIGSEATVRIGSEGEMVRDGWRMAISLVALTL